MESFLYKFLPIYFPILKLCIIKFFYKSVFLVNARVLHAMFANESDQIYVSLFIALCHFVSYALVTEKLFLSYFCTLSLDCPILTYAEPHTVEIVICAFGSYLVCWFTAVSSHEADNAATSDYNSDDMIQWRLFLVMSRFTDSRYPGCSVRDTDTVPTGRLIPN